MEEMDYMTCVEITGKLTQSKNLDLEAVIMPNVQWSLV